jgi:hypothetical protein
MTIIVSSEGFLFVACGEAVTPASPQAANRDPSSPWILINWPKIGFPIDRWQAPNL